MAGQRKTIVIVAVVGLLAAVAAFGGLVFYFKFRLPNFAQMRTSIQMDIVAANGDDSTRVVGPKAPGWVPIELISDYALMAVISSEDTTFYSHKGIDLHELQESIKKDIREKRWARGASTITQQVVKNVFLSHEKTLWRKFREILWASELEKEFTKSEILCFYLNMVEFGPGLYGIGQASTYYFGVVPARLSVREAAFLAMLLPSPRKYHTYFKKKALTPWAKNRVEHIIETMFRLGYIDEESRNRGLGESLWGVEKGEPGGPDGGVSDDPSLEDSDASTEGTAPAESAAPSPVTPPSGEAPSGSDPEL